MTILLPDGSPAPKRLALATKEGNDIPNQTRLELPQNHLEALDKAATIGLRNYQLRCRTATYDCVGLVFASRRTWIDAEEIPTILKEDGYRLLNSRDELQPGDVVVYRGRTTPVLLHIAVVWDFLRAEERDYIQMLSKWGPAGEYFHDMDSVPPLCGVPSEYWTDRPA